MPPPIRKSPKADELERRIRDAGRISARDLAASDGGKSGNQEARLAKAIAAGLVVKEIVKTRGVSGRGLLYWVWRGDGVPRTDERQASPHRAGPRKCLCCGNKFMSSHAGNRQCPRCRANNVNNASPFDTPAEVRYH